MDQRDVAIIGAGPAGISVALSLRDRGLRPVLIDRANEVGSSWRARYDALKLNTGRPFSHLPGRRYPRGTPMFPSRDQVVDHLDRHAHEDGIELRLGTAVHRIDRGPGGWHLHTSTEDIVARQLVVATGNEHTAHIPQWPGSDGFAAISHSSTYRNPDPYRGNKVLVVGCGSSGMEIAYDLATGGAAKVWMAVRNPPNILLRSLPGGLPGDVISRPLFRAPVRVADAISRVARRANLGDLSEFGLPMPAEGVFYQVKRHEKVPALIDMEVIDAVRDGSIEVVPTVESFESDVAILVDGSRVDPHAVILATGYRRGLESLVAHLGVLDANGKPIALNDKPAAPGLRFVGFELRPSFIGYMAKQSRRMAKAIARELRSAH